MIKEVSFSIESKKDEKERHTHKRAIVLYIAKTVVL